MNRKHGLWRIFWKILTGFSLFVFFCQATIYSPSHCMENPVYRLAAGYLLFGVSRSLFHTYFLRFSNNTCYWQQNNVLRKKVCLKRKRTLFSQSKLIKNILKQEMYRTKQFSEPGMPNIPFHRVLWDSYKVYKKYTARHFSCKKPLI